MIPPLDARIFPAKLLLFGEHVLLLGATALAVPVTAFGGCLVRFNPSSDDPMSSDDGLKRAKYSTRLLQFAQSDVLRSVEIIDTALFKRELDNGLFFRSNIPTGYGLGSSGALCAAIYDRYARDKTKDLATLKTIFACMESFFHGNSSGIDPLTSYVGEPILIQNKIEVNRAFSRNWAAEKPKVFLLDSQLPRRTGPLVEWFLTQSREPSFAQKLSEEYLPAHEAVVHAWLSADNDLFWPNLRRVSAFQFEHFAHIIPETLKGFWEQNLDNQDFVLKICGAGGGGFALGFAHNAEMGQNLAKDFSIVFPFA